MRCWWPPGTASFPGSEKTILKPLDSPAQPLTLRRVKRLLHLKSAVLALVLTCMFVGNSHAQAWSPATFEQLGVPYYRYLAAAYASGQTIYLPGGAAAAAVQGFGPNVVGYAINISEGQNTTFSAQAAGSTQQYYYEYLGLLLGYQNYLNPTYAQQLESFYFSYGSQLYSYYSSLASYYNSYYLANANYYENLIF